MERGKLRNKWATGALACLLLGASAVPVSGAGTMSVSTTTVTVWLLQDEPIAYVEGKKTELNSPALWKDGNVRYVPLRFMSEQLGLTVKYNAKTQRTELGTARALIELDPVNKSVFINGAYLPFDNVARMYGDTLMVRENWLYDFMGAKYTYHAERGRLEVTFVKKPPSHIDDTGNSRPVARFTTGKTQYRIGEPVKWIDLSYDPDAEPVQYEWEGKEEAYFSAGKHQVSLRVKDGGGLTSERYTRTIEVTNEVMYSSPLLYKLNTYPLQSLIPTSWTDIYTYFYGLPTFAKKETTDRSRKLLVSDSPEVFEDKGILYADTVTGKARLYASHINGMDEPVQFVIMATNRGQRDVTIRTTNKGEVYPSKYANLIGHEASVEFLLGDARESVLTIPRGESRTYVQMPDFYPEQGVNAIYDVETDGPIEFTFMAMDASIETPTSTYPLLYKQLEPDRHIRGTFPITEKTWEIDASRFTTPTQIVFGDNDYDVWQFGYDPTRKKEVTDSGNYGVVYRVHADKPRKMAILLQATGGPFKGPLKINGEFVLAPTSGVISAFEHVQLLARTTGNEPELTIEFTPPAGSAFPVNLIFYPLD